GEPVKAGRGNAAIGKPDVLGEAEVPVVGAHSLKDFGVGRQQPDLGEHRVGIDENPTRNRPILGSQPRAARNVHEQIGAGTDLSGFGYVDAVVAAVWTVAVDPTITEIE